MLIVDDDIVARLGGRFQLSALIQRRLVELMDGAKPLVARGNLSDLEVVIKEIMDGRLSQDSPGANVPDPTTLPLEASLDSFSADLPELLERSAGRFVTYLGPTRLGVFDTRKEALAVGYAHARFRYPFLVKRIETQHPSETSTWELGRTNES